MMKNLNVGTRSILFGVHQFLIHPWFVAYAWYKLYGFPWRMQYWVAFFVHDLGYWGKPNMDGEEGEEHVWLGAKVMGWLFDRDKHKYYCHESWTINDKDIYFCVDNPSPVCKQCPECEGKNTQWRDFTLYHSRFYAKKHNEHFSRLCVADKYSFCLTPKWLYMMLAKASGELNEYVFNGRQGVKYTVHFQNLCNEARRLQIDPRWFSRSPYEIVYDEWHTNVTNYLEKWVHEHKDLKEDKWTEYKPSGSKSNQVS